MNTKEHLIKEEEATFPSTPFLLWEKDANDQPVGYGPYVVESWKVSHIHVHEDCRFTQTFDSIVHKAAKEEIERYMKGEYNRDEWKTRKTDVCYS